MDLRLQPMKSYAMIRQKISQLHTTTELPEHTAEYFICTS